ncbi:MAG: REP-associated tyrosine transposase [Bacillota bacterium]
MARVPRTKSNTGYYHVVLRGNNRSTLFFDNQDRLTFLDYLSKQKDKNLISINAYCLMDNHIHILIQETDNNLSTAMRSICTSYALFINKKYQRTGHLFDNRYRSETINDERYLFAALRYIHQNPVKAGICSNVENYRWSSDQYYRNPANNKFVSTTILEFIDKDKSVAISNYIRLMQTPEGNKFLDIPDDPLTDSEIIKIIKLELSKAEISNIKDDRNREKLTKLVLSLHLNNGVSIRKIASSLGASKGFVQNLLKK